ncbi:hypothetical protein MRX96_014985 [Rhipicephalus microplus]
MAHEGQLPRYSTIGGGSYTAYQEMRQASSTQENCSSDKTWNDILNEWYEKTLGNPPNPQVPAGNGYAERNATKHQDQGEALHVGRMHEAEKRTSFPHPVSSSGASDDAIPSTSCTVIEAPACSESNVW